MLFRPAPRYRFLDLLLKLPPGRWHLPVSKLDEKNHPLIRPLLNLLPNRKVILQGLCSCHSVKDVVNLRRAEPDTTGVAESNKVSCSFQMAMPQPPGRGDEAQTHRTPSERPIMIKPPPLSALERVMITWSPWSKSKGTKLQHEFQE